MPILLQINSTLNWGSTGRIAEQIALLAQSMGWDCYIAHGGRYVNKSNIKSLRISSKFDNRIHALKSILYGKHGLGSVCATRRLISKIDKLKPDIIHLHNIHGYYINYKILFEYLSTANIPVVWTIHDCWSMTGQCTHFFETGCTKWQTGCHDCPELNYAYKTFADRTDKNWKLKKQLYSSLQSLTIVTVSKWLESIVRKSILKDKEVRVIPNGIDTELFKQTAVNDQTILKLIPSDKFVLMAVATEWDDTKGLCDFMKLSGLLKNDELIVLVGADENQNLSVPSNIVLIPRTKDQAELAVLYNRADVVLSLSYGESMGLTPVEGMACGTPVIVYDNTAQSESITDATGIVVKTGDIDGVNEAVKMIRQNGKSHYSPACRERAEKYYDKDARFEEYIKLYEDLLTKK